MMSKHTLQLSALAVVLAGLAFWWWLPTADATKGSGLVRPPASALQDARVSESALAEANVDVEPAVVLTLTDEIQSAWNIADPQERAAAIDEILSRLNAENLPHVRGLIERLAPPTLQHKVIYISLLSHWARFDGKGAVSYAMDKLDGDLRLDAGTAATHSWASRDMAAAARFVSTLPDDYGADYLTYDLVFPYMDADPALAMQWVQTLPPTRSSNAAGHAMAYWLHQDPVAATQWTIQNADARREPQAIVEMAVHWTREDLALADDYVTRLPTGEAKSVAMEAIVDWLSSEQPAQVADWLNQYEASPQLDRALAKFATNVSTDDSASARTWAMAISDPEFRLATLSEINRRTGETHELQRPDVLWHKGDLASSQGE